MNELVYGVWEGKVIDPANGGATLLSQIEKLGEYEPGNPIRALMGWDGFLLFAEPAVRAAVRASIWWTWPAPTWR